MLGSLSLSLHMYMYTYVYLYISAYLFSLENILLKTHTQYASTKTLYPPILHLSNKQPMFPVSVNVTKAHPITEGQNLRVKKKMFLSFF